MKRLLTILAALALPGLAAGQMTQTGPAPAVQQHKAPAAKPQDARERFESMVRADLDRIEAGIARLEKKAADEGKAVPRAIQALRGKANAVEAKLDQLKTAGIKEWDGMRADVQKSMKDLRKTYHDFLTPAPATASKKAAGPSRGYTPAPPQP